MRAISPSDMKTNQTLGCLKKHFESGVNNICYLLSVCPSAHQGRTGRVVQVVLCKDTRLRNAPAAYTICVIYDIIAMTHYTVNDIHYVFNCIHT
jgi:hypothetical protein